MKLENLVKKNNIKDYYLYSDYAAKVKYISSFNKKCKVILVTATNPTKFGEGKTTVAIGLNDAFKKLKYNSLLVLREPSLGPVFGIKGGATGGGKARIVPEDKINLHFTGDFHAITSANNLICAVIDNEIFQGNKLDIKKVLFHRCMDMNDRALRDITLNGGLPRDERFDITAASEIMAIFCLAKDIDDLKRRIGNIIIGYNSKNENIYVRDLNIVDAVISLLIDSFNPNVVKSLENNLVFVHGGPFANIAHGCNSYVSLSTASNYSDYLISEAGFGADLGGFKFLDILSRNNNIDVYACVLVTTIRALKFNGDGSLSNGIENLKVHVENLKLMNMNVIVTLNKFDDDSIKDINYIKNYCKELNVLFEVNTVYQDGSKGAIKLAKKILNLNFPMKIKQIYKLSDSLDYKINSYLKNICHADGYDASDEVKELIKKYDKYKYPICVAKTQYSISDNSKLLGYPKNYKVTIKNIEVKNGAEFIIVYLGNIITMPGLSKHPQAMNIKVVDNKIIGIN